MGAPTQILGHSLWSFCRNGRSACGDVRWGVECDYIESLPPVPAIPGPGGFGRSTRTRAFHDRSDYDVRVGPGGDFDLSAARVSEMVYCRGRATPSSPTDTVQEQYFLVQFR